MIHAAEKTQTRLAGAEAYITMECALADTPAPLAAQQGDLIQEQSHALDEAEP